MPFISRSWTSWVRRVSWTDWSRASVDTMSMRQAQRIMWAQSRRSRQARIPAAPGCDGSGMPLTAAVTAANVADTTIFQAVLGNVPPVLTPSGRRRCPPDTGLVRQMWHAGGTADGTTRVSSYWSGP
jgi:hypothetical protein